MSNREVASELAKAEARINGDGPVPGGAADAAQSLQDKQNNLAAKVSEVTSRSSDETTQEDVSEPVAAETQSQADKNADAVNDTEENNKDDNKEEREAKEQDSQCHSDQSPAA